MENIWIELQEKIGYKFKNLSTLIECFTHSSFANEKNGEKNYERLEFLGDSVLGFVVSDYLYKNQHGDEGSMTEIKQRIVSSVPLAHATKNLEIEGYLLKESTLKITDNMRENLFEAVIGAIYFDGGLEEARKFIMNNLVLLSDQSIFVKSENYKSKLNEFTSKRKLGNIKYSVKEKFGKDHEPLFLVEVLLNNNFISLGSGANKKSAEQDAAEKAYKILKDGKN